MIENRAVGIKSREVYEAPAAIALIAAHSALEDVVLTKDEARLKRPLEQRWTELVYEGRGSARPARRSTRSSTRRSSSSRGDVRARAASERGGRHRSPLGAHALRRAARLVRHGRDVPARGRRGLHPHRRARDRVGSGAGAREDACVSSGRSQGGSRAASTRRCGSSCARTTRSSSSTTARRPPSTHAVCTPPGCSPPEELDEVETRLARDRQDRRSPRPADEDVHTAIERLLGDVGRKIHAGRSRNDQVAAAFRLYVLDACAEARDEIDALALVVLSFAEAEAETAMPGYTHLQRGPAGDAGTPPARVGGDARPRPRHALPLPRRPPARARSARARSPARRSTLPPPPRQLRNSIDAVADRDFALDYLYAAAVLFTHLSRIGEEIVLWATRRVRVRPAARDGRDGLVDDAAEAQSRRRGARPRQGRDGDRAPDGAAGDREGLPLAYDRDLQEDKPPVFATRRDVRLALGALTVLVSGLEVDRERLAAAAADPLLCATDAAEALVGRASRSATRTSRSPRAVRDGHVRAAGRAGAAARHPAPAGWTRRSARPGARFSGATDRRVT